MITGANSGRGRAAAIGFVKIGAGVVIVSRGQKRGEVAQTNTISENRNQSVELVLADLS